MHYSDIYQGVNQLFMYFAILTILISSSIFYIWVINGNLKAIQQLPTSERTVKELKLRKNIYRYRFLLLFLYLMFSTYVLKMYFPL